MYILKTKTALDELFAAAAVFFDEEMIKAVVDINKNIIALDAELHVDLEAMLLESGSSQADLWGINLHVKRDDMIEFDSIINIRPRQNNPGRGVFDEDIQRRIREVVDSWIIRN